MPLRKVDRKSSKILLCVTLGGGIRLQELFYSILSNFLIMKLLL